MTRRRSASFCEYMAVLSLLGIPSLAGAQVNDIGDANRHRLLLELGGVASMALGEICESGSDWTGCNAIQPAAGLSADAGWLIRQDLSLGVFAAHQWVVPSSNDSYAERLQWLTLEGRWTPRSKGFSVKFDVGLARYHQTYDPPDAGAPGATVTQWAPAAGVGAGWVLLQAGRFSMALDLRLWLTIFGSRAPAFTPDRTARELGPLPWFSLGLQFGYRP